MLLGDVRLTLHQRLLETIETNIINRVWLPGDQLPAENIIATRYKLAVGTVRKAIAELVKQGLLERKQGVGTFVRKPSFDNSFFKFFRFYHEQKTPEGRILSREVVPAPLIVAQKLGIVANAPVIIMSRLRLFGTIPFASEKIWLDYAKFNPLMQKNEAELTPLLYPVYASYCDQIVAKAKENLTIGVANNEDVILLNLTKQSPIIVIHRLAFGFDNQPIEWRQSRCRCENFEYQINIH